MNKVVSDLEEGLKKQTYDLSKNTGLAKYIKQYKEAKDELEQQIDLEPITAENAAKVVKMGNKVTDIYKKINQAKAKLQKEDDGVLKTLFPDKFSAKVDKGVKAINKFFHEIEDKQDKKTRLSNLETDLNRFQTELTRLENRRVKIDIEADLSKAKKDLSDFEEQRRELLKQVQEKLTPSEQIGTDGKTAIQRYSDQVQTSRDKITRKSQAISDAKKSSERALTSEEQAELDQLRARYEGRTNEYTIERNSTRKIYNKYAEELATRRTAVEMGVEDTGRSRRKLGGLSSDELQITMEEARTRLAELEAENTAALQRIEQIKTAPSTDKKNTIQRLQRELEAEQKVLKNAEDNLTDARKARQKEIDFGQEQVQKFESGEAVAGIDQSDLTILKEYNEELKKTGERITDLQLEKSTNSFSTAEQKESSIGTKKSQIAEREREIQKLKNTIEDLENSTTIDELFKKLNELNIPTDNIEKSEEGIRALRDSLKQMDTTTVTQVRDALKALGIEGDDAEDVIKKLTRALDNVDDSAKDINRATQDMENLKQQILDFFSISNAVQLFKNTIQSALETVKELDATMTEAAVVTDFSVNDMWEQLPRYSAEAQKLGVSINGMYQATTLYYQQGLKTNEAMELGVETMKMAKIAGMESADATKAMTSALRGFNLELNETSAMRVNDVYSQLAAVTAADTSQIANAMEKTASIAAAANMEFETTAAFLAQIIETTQEAPETAGTAMKTIVARFSEVKSLASQGLVSGEDSEGEVIDVNKIQTALRSVGISMDEFFAGTEGLDSVLLKLAEKWGTLDFETQRYIATMAAGSRQQSRFIAMMSDYGRTTELVSAANNSAGASQKQYEKTLDSLATALTKLKNAWDQFAMGLANNEILKFGVNLLTGLLQTINKVIDTISGGNGLIKSVVSLGLAIGGLALGGKVLDAVFRSLGSSLAVGAGLKQVDKELTEKQAEATGKHVIAKKAEEKVQKQTIRGLFEEIGAQGISIVFTKVKNRLTWDSVKAKAADTLQTLKNNAAMLKGIGIVAIYVAALALAVVGIVNLFKAWDEAGSANDKAIEAMNQSLQEFTQQAQEAKSELEELTQTREGLEDMQETFTGLKKGTTEWKKQLIEINSQVLELLNTYPSLASYVSRGNEDQLMIDDAGWEALEQVYMDKYQASMAGQIGAQIRKTEIEEQAALEQAQSDRVQTRYQNEEFINSEKFQNAAMMTTAGAGALTGAAIGGALGSVVPIIGTAIGALLGGAVGVAAGWLGVNNMRTFSQSEDEITRQETGMEKDAYMKFAAAAAEAGLSQQAGSSREEYRKLFEEMGLDKDYNFEEVYSKVRKLGSDFDTLGLQAYELQTAQELYTKSLVGQIADSTGGVAGSKVQEQAETLVSGVQENLSENIASRASELIEDENYVTKDGEATDKLVNQYAAINKMTADEVRAKIADSALSVETMVTSLATNEMESKLSDQLQKTTAALENLAKDAKTTQEGLSQLMRVLSTDGRDILVSDNNLFQGLVEGKSRVELADEAVQKQVVDEFLKATIGQTSTQAGLDWQPIWENLNLGAEAFEEVSEIADELGIVLGDNLSASAASSFIKKLQEQVNSGKDIEGAQLISRMLTDITKTMSSEDASKFTEAFDNINWSSVTEVENFSETLKQLGFNMNEMGDKVQDLKNKTKEFADSTYNLNEEEKAKVVDKTLVLKEQIKEGKVTFTEDEKNMFGAGLKDYWIKRGNNWGLTQDFSIEDLISSVNEKSAERTSTEQSADAYRRKNDLTNTVSTTGFSKFEYGTYADAGKLYDEVKGAHLNNYTYEERNGQPVYTYYDNIWSRVDGEGKRGARTYEEFLKGLQSEGKFQDEILYYMMQEMGMTKDEAIKYTQDEENLQNVVKGFTMFGSTLSHDQKIAFAAASSRFINTTDPLIQERYDWDNVKLRLFGTESRGQGERLGDTQWDTLEALFGEDSFAKFEFEGATGDNVLSNESLAQIYQEIVGGIEKDPEKQKRDLENEYKKILEDSKNVTEEIFWQELALKTPEAAYAATKSDIEAEAKAAEGAINNLAVSTSGVNELVNKWKTSNTEMLKELKLDTVGLRAIALQLNESEQAFRNFSSVLEDNIDLLSQGPEVGFAYYQSLEKVTGAARMAFGSHITENFIASMIPKLEQLRSGGEAAAQAFEELAWAQAQLYAQGQLNNGVWDSQMYDDYLVAAKALGQINWTETPQLNLYDWFTSLNLAGLSYEQFVESIKNNPAYATLNITTGDASDDIISALDWSGMARSMFSDSDKDDDWENPYDVFYNTLAKINEAMREREKLERQYQRLMDRGDATGQKLVENLKLQTAELQEEANLQRDIVKGRQQQMENYVANQGLKKYGWIENGEVRINWAEINKNSDSEKGQEIQDYISQLEEWSESLKEAEDRLEEIEDEVHEINETGRDEYLNLEQEVTDALRESYQKQIDELSNINKSINDANSRLIEAMQSSIEKDRQARENERTEEEIADKQARLAYLQQDTSGANALEAMQLEKEIAEEQENYTDSLIDQKISELQEQNDKAAEQRERQIDVAQAQLEQWFANGNHWKKVYELIQAGTDQTGKLLDRGDLIELLKEANAFKGMSEQSQMKWMEKTQSSVAAAWAWLKEHGNYLINTKTGSINNSDFGNVDASTVKKPISPESPETNAKVQEIQDILRSELLYLGKKDGVMNEETRKAEARYRDKYDLDKDADIITHRKETNYQSITGYKFPPSPPEAYIKNYGWKTGPIPGSNQEGDYTIDSNGIVWVSDRTMIEKKADLGTMGNIYYKGKFHALNSYTYKTGGLADYTGPAWLDGTKSKPELVLNARDTQNFIQLKDILASLMTNTPKSTEKSGDMSFDIDINVETINDETDLDMIANYIENKIVSSANYRNNTIVGGHR